jgi:quercetin dioxygenase-like cupin family protein
MFNLHQQLFHKCIGRIKTAHLALSRREQPDVGSKGGTMRRMALVLAPVLAVGLALGAIGGRVLLAQSLPVTRTILQQKDLAEAEGKELIMYRADIVPGGVVGKHFHPGPEMVYVMEGALTIEHDGHPPVTLKTGESAYIPSKHIHNAWNASTTAHAKVMVFLVGEKGQPLAIAVR